MVKAAKAKSGKKTARQKKKAGGIRQRLSSLRALPVGLVVRRLAVTLLIVALLPFALAVLYRVESVQPVSTLMLGRYLTFQPVDRRWVELEDVAPALYQSVVMSEDGQFCFHHGVDLGELKAQVELALDGEATRGASTITMQTAKNLFLWNGRSFLRKAVELPLAVWIDLVLPKHRIMEIYLNVAEWDEGGVFGVEAGSQSHFGKSSSTLTRREAALLAVTLPNPILREPSKPNSGMRKLASVIQNRADQSGAYVKCLQ